jgi:hypothetical protein
MPELNSRIFYFCPVKCNFLLKNGLKMEINTQICVEYQRGSGKIHKTGVILSILIYWNCGGLLTKCICSVLSKETGDLY